MTIITPTGIIGINSITSSGSTLVFQSASGTSPVVTGLDNISSAGVITATRFVGNLTGNVNSSGVSTFAAGSASAPSISPSGDSNTGIFFPSPDTIAFAEGGVEALRIDSNANIGIGTANPPGKFAISGTTADTFAAVLSNPNNRVRGDYQRAFGTAHPVVIIGNNDRNTDGEYGILCLYAGDLTSLNGNYCGLLEFGAPETGKSNGNASLKAYIAGGLEGSGGSTGGVGGNIQFATRGDNASGVPIERMRIDSIGRITTSYQPSFSAYHSVSQNISANTWTKVSLNTTRFNIGSNYNTSTSNFTAPVSGRYFVSYTIQFDLQTVEYLYSSIKINGNFYHYGEGRRLLNPGGGTWGGDNTLNAAQLVNLAANDIVDLWAYSTAANTLQGGDLRASFAIHLLG